MATTPVTEQTRTRRVAGHPVVVGVDGGPASRAALDWAVTEAAALGRPLHLVHAHSVAVQWPDAMTVPPVPPAPTPVEDRVLVDAVARVGDVVDRAGVATTSVGGSAAAFLVEASAEATAVVLGAPHHGALGSAIVGSTALDVAAHALCPVVLVRADLPVSTLGHGVVVASDGSDASRSALEEGFRRADRLGLPLTVVHVWYMDYTGPDFLVPDLELERRRLGERERALIAETVAQVATRHPDVVVRQEVVHGDPVKVLSEVSHGAEVVIVGSHGRGEVAGLLLGSVSQGLVRHAACPVMVVRPGTRPR